MTARQLGTFAFCLLAAFGSASATTYVAMSLDEVTARAELAFYGTVAETKVEAREGDPWTVVTFEVVRGFKGSEADETLELAFLGGQLPSGLRVDATGMPAFSVGDTVLVFAYLEEFYSPIVGFSQGLFYERQGRFLDLQGRSLGLDNEVLSLESLAGSSAEEVLVVVAEMFGGAP